MACDAFTDTTGTAVSRRSFTAGAAAVGVAALAAGVTARDAMAGTPELAWDFECEVLVIGGGGGGTMAAVTAAEAGAKVMVLEKAPEGGGASRISGGNIFFTRDVDEVTRYLVKAYNGTTPEDVIRAYAEEGVNQIPWLEEHGFTYFEIPQGAGLSTFDNIDGRMACGIVSITDESGNPNDDGGRWFWEWAKGAIEELGIDFRVNAPATQLVQDPQTKEILGARALIEGKEVLVKATKGVVLATGGFCSSRELVANFLEPQSMVTCAGRYNTGDGLKMAMRVGADIWHMNVFNHHGFGFVEPGAEVARWYVAFYYAPIGAYFYVNRTGKRFTDEDANLFSGHSANWMFDELDTSLSATTTKLQNVPFYAVFDETFRLEYPLYDQNLSGGAQGLPYEMTGLDPWSSDNSDEIEKGWILKADTPEELAELIRIDGADDGFDAMDSEVFAETFRAYNEGAAANDDLEFGRTNLVGLQTPPFYAVKLQPIMYTTSGGPRKDATSHVVDLDGNVIPRLYTAGVEGSSTGYLYCLDGCNWGDVMNWGRIAGRNAAAEEPWE
jgi:hypothetical protein